MLADAVLKCCCCKLLCLLCYAIAEANRENKKDKNQAEQSSSRLLIIYPFSLTNSPRQHRSIDRVLPALGWR